MNLIIPVNLQALRVTPNDASSVTKRSDLFSGPTTSFDALPWRDGDANEYPGRVTKANVSTNVNFPLAGNVTEQIEAGIHLHWALPEGLTRGVQQPDGALVFPAVPNRWLVTRILRLSGAFQVKQWIVESDYLMTGDEYTGTYYPATRRKCIAIPVGWNLLPDTNPNDGGAVYYSPSRRMGKVFELNGWQPVVTPPGAPLDQIRHLDEFKVSAGSFIAAGRTFEPLKAVGPNGPTFAAYYPDCRSAFGFHDLFDDLTGGFDLANASFQVSYHVAGWHSHASDDPLQSAAFIAARAKAATVNQAKPVAERLDDVRLSASVVQDTYKWCYDPSVGTPTRCVYGGQVSALPWDTTGANPNLRKDFPKCYLPPMDNDPSVRLAVGNSTPAALAALVKHEWVEWTKSTWEPGSGQAAVSDRIEKDLEFLVDALQLGLLHRLGKSTSLAQLEQDLHQNGFGSRRGGSTWMIRQVASVSDKTDPSRFDAPDAVLPPDSTDAADKLGALNAAQLRLNELLNVIDSCQHQIFIDWYHYITTVYGSMDDKKKNALKEGMKNYIAEQILDLWAKLEAAFGKKAAASPATGKMPVFFSNAGNYISSKDGKYTSSSPAPSLAGQIVAAANDLTDLLKAKYSQFELQRTEDARYWESNEPVIVTTGDSLAPARRNGAAEYLPCRLSGQLLGELKAQRASNTSSVRAAEVTSLILFAVPGLAANETPESRDTRPLLDDIKALMVEACLLDSLLAPALVTKLAPGAASEQNLRSAMIELAGKIRQAWQKGAPAGAIPPMPAVLKDQSAKVDDLQVTWPGQAPQGVALTYQAGAAWDDPFLPLYLVWTAEYTAFEKGLGAAADSYAPKYLTGQFQLDENFIDLTFGGSQPKAQAGGITVSGAIPLSSRASQPLLDQIRQYLEESPKDNPQLQKVIDHLQDKPLLSQGLNGIGAALVSRGVGLQMTPFDPFYDLEPTVAKLGAGDNSFDYTNILTHFVGQVTGGATDQVPIGDGGYSPLRAGHLDIRQMDVVDVFGRKRRVIDPSVEDDRKKIIVSWQLTEPGGSVPGRASQIYLPPRVAQAARLRLRWLSATDDAVATNSHPATSPVCGWIVPNHLDNSLMLFTPAGQPLGSLGAFGAQATVTWQPAPGHPAREMDLDLAGDGLRHLRKLADFILGKERAFFKALMDLIETAHTYILPADTQAAQAQAVLMGRPLALLRAGLRLELAGLPCFDTSAAGLEKTLSANANKTYDWTQRNSAGVLNVDYPVRLGDRNHLEDGLIAYLLDGPDPYKVIYAPAAAATGTTGVVRPAADTLCLKLRANIDPPAAPYANPNDQIADLQKAATPPAQTIVSILMDPRGRVHASMGVLPVKAIDLPAEIYSQALRNIEVAFFTHPVLRGAQGLALPAPDEAGFLWNWTTSVKEQGVVHPRDEDLPAFQIGDRAHFSYSPQVAEDGWLKLKPQPKSEPKK